MVLPSGQFQSLAPIRLIPKKKELPTALKILTSPKTTLALLGGLATALFPATILPRLGSLLLPKTIGGVAKTAFVVGAISAAPELARTFNPFTAGRKAAPFIADPSRLLPKEKPIREKVSDVLKKGGIGAAAAAAVVGAAVVTKKAIEKAREVKIPSVSLPSAVLPAGLLPTLPSLTPDTQPLGAVKQPIEEVPKEIKGLVEPMKITNTFNPSIDIRISKKRSFINQQINIKSHARKRKGKRGGRRRR